MIIYIYIYIKAALEYQEFTEGGLVKGGLALYVLLLYCYC